MISIWDLGPEHLGKYKDVTDGVNVWSGKVIDIFEEKGYALREDGRVERMRERHAFVGEQRHYVRAEDEVVKGAVIEG